MAMMFALDVCKMKSAVTIDPLDVATAAPYLFEGEVAWGG
jgi:hypothetical protein